MEKLMRTRNIRNARFESRLASIAALTVLSLLVAGSSRLVRAQPSQPTTFPTPAEAGNALFQAVKSDDEQAVAAILGADKEETSSGDEVEDQLEREQFSHKYQEMHRLVREPDGKTMLYIGAENWPFPIPLSSKNGAWYFDSKAGKQEILLRTVGENEVSAIQVCNEFIAGKKKQQTTTAPEDDPVARYAQDLVSASTTSTGKTVDTTPGKEPKPFQGYYFHIVNNNGGLALCAYPAQYHSSGVMTFIISH